MNRLTSSAAGLVGLAMLAGCASSQVVERQSEVAGEWLERPQRIIVYDFAATPDDVPSNAAIDGNYQRRATPQTEEDIAVGRALADSIARKLVLDIQQMGLPAVRAKDAGTPQPGDILISGQFVTIDPGNRLARMTIGFGAGRNELRTVVEGYQVTGEGTRRLGSREFVAAGSRMPGVMVPVTVGAVTGRVVMSTVVAGSMNVASELGPERMSSAGKRTADAIAKELRKIFKARGWVT